MAAIASLPGKHLSAPNSALLYHNIVKISIFLIFFLMDFSPLSPMSKKPRFWVSHQIRLTDMEFFSELRINQQAASPAACFLNQTNRSLRQIFPPISGSRLFFSDFIPYPPKMSCSSSEKTSAASRTDPPPSSRIFHQPSTSDSSVRNSPAGAWTAFRISLPEALRPQCLPSVFP